MHDSCLNVVYLPSAIKFDREQPPVHLEEEAEINFLYFDEVNERKAVPDLNESSN